MTTVLRVKRRKPNKPAEALLVMCKVKKDGSRYYTQATITTLEQTDRKIFHYATTVKSKTPINENLKEKVRKAILQRQGKKTTSSVASEKFDEQPMTSLKNKLKGMTLTHHHSLAKLEKLSSPYAKEQRRSSSPVQSSRKLVAPGMIDLRQRAWKNKYAKTNHGTFRKLTKHSRQDLTIQSKRYHGLLKYQTNFKPSTISDEVEYDLYYCHNENDWNVCDILYVKPCTYRELLKKKPGEEQRKKPDDEKKAKNSKRIAKKHNHQYENDEDSTDEDERRLIFDEEEINYDSDEYDVNGRDDNDDAYDAFFSGGHGDVESCSNFDYDDSFVNELTVESGIDYENDNYDDCNPLNDVNDCAGDD